VTADSYYTMTVLRVPLADWPVVRADILREGDAPSVHESRTMGYMRATFTWTFLESDVDASWSAYHAVIRAYAVCVSRRIKCAFATRGPTGEAVDMTVSPAMRLHGGKPVT
jgi:hypothetical protein